MLHMQQVYIEADTIISLLTQSKYKSRKSIYMTTKFYQTQNYDYKKALCGKVKYY